MPRRVARLPLSVIGGGFVAATAVGLATGAALQIAQSAPSPSP